MRLKTLLSTCIGLMLFGVVRRHSLPGKVLDATLSANKNELLAGDEATITLEFNVGSHVLQKVDIQLVLPSGLLLLEPAACLQRAAKRGEAHIVEWRVRATAPQPLSVYVILTAPQQDPVEARSLSLQFNQDVTVAH